MEADYVAQKAVPLNFEAVIRPANAADLPKLEWFGQYWHYRKIFERTFREHLQGRRLMLVADVNGFPVGQVFIQFESIERRFADGRERAYLYSLRVLTPFQKRGLGTQLIMAAEEYIRARGCQWITIAVAKDNLGAQRLYGRLGFTVFSEDPGKWSFIDPGGRRHFVDEPCWVMQKPLA